MELKVIKQDDKSMTLEIKGETIAFVNLLKEELWNDKNVSEAAYIKEHPYLAEPKLFLKVYRGSPMTALEKASERITKGLEEFSEEFKKAQKS